MISAKRLKSGILKGVGMLRIFSWNVNGIRAVIRKGALQKFIEEYEPDILCLQETKAKQGQAEIDLPEYEELWNSAERPGYSGTAIFTKIKPLSVKDDFDNLKEGRVLVAEFEKFYLVDVYTPNSKPDLSRLKLRETEWDPGFLEYLKELEKDKPVVVCGDFNAAHEEIDLARPKTNHHNAGFTDEERGKMTQLLDAGFIDTFRYFYPDKTDVYSWWSYRFKAREKNAGWRIDYFIVSEDFKDRIKGASIHTDIFDSDHCPVELDFE